MKFSIGRGAAAVAASSMLLAMLCLTSARAQDADESGAADANQTPSVAQVAGTWTGMDTNIDSGQDSSGPMTLDLTQILKRIGGNFSLTTGDETPSGNVTGTISKDHLTLTFHATSGTQHACTASVVANVTGDTMQGTYLVNHTGKHCKGKGTFELTLTP
jgi:hypothetical protein